MVADLISTFLVSAGKLYHDGCYGNINICCNIYHYILGFILSLVHV